MFRVKLTTSIRGNRELNKQTAFALASSLTFTAKEIQAATIKALDKGQGGAFDIRTGWTKPSNVFGIRTKPATKTNLKAVIGTAAEWLEKFVREPAGSIVLKLPRSEFIAIPTSNVRRTKRDLIRAMQRPQAIRGKRDIVLPMRSGKGAVLFQEQGRGRNVKRVALYFLVPRARIRERDVLFGPAKRIFEKRFAKIYEQQLKKAFAPRGA